MRAGQARRQLDLAQGRRGRVRAPGEPRAALRCRGRGHGLRREGAGRHPRAQDVDLPALLRDPHPAGRFPGRGHHLRSQRVRHRDGDRGTQQLRGRLHRGDALDPHAPAAREGVGRHLERQLLVPRQRPGARGDPHRVPVLRDSRRAHDGHRQCRPARRVRRARSGAARARRGRRAEPAAGRWREPHGAPRHLRGELQVEGQGRDRGPRVARSAGRGAAHACAGEGNHHLHHRGHRGGAPEDGRARRPADPGDRRPADGRHERRRRSVRRRQDVPPAGGEERAGDEAGGRRISSRSSRPRRRCSAAPRSRRAPSSPRRSRATCTTSARTSSGSCSSATTSR